LTIKNVQKNMKNVLITGAYGNLGKAVRSEFNQPGYRVLTTYETGTLQLPNEPNAFEVDLSDEHQVIQLVRKIVKDFGTIDTLILLAGGFDGGGFESSNADILQKMIRLNFQTAYHLARLSFNQMKQQTNGGRIVLIGARPALIPQIGKDYVAYAISKSMLFDLAKLFNAAAAPSDIVCSVIVPGTIDTPSNRKYNPEADFSKWVKPEAIASMIRHITGPDGQTLREPIIKMYAD
jgi:NAD(P)-dependent dehydrogenase (short-subunit alcohol dehydrogenase family)